MHTMIIFLLQERKLTLKRLISSANCKVVENGELDSQIMLIITTVTGLWSINCDPEALHLLLEFKQMLPEDFGRVNTDGSTISCHNSKNYTSFVQPSQWQTSWR